MTDDDDELGPTTRNWIHQATRDEVRADNIALHTEIELLKLTLRDTVPLAVHRRALADKDDIIQRYRKALERRRKGPGAA